MDSVAFDLGDQWSLCYLRRPLETHRFRSPSANDAFSAILQTLKSYVFGRKTRTYHKNSLALKVRRIPEVMWVDNQSGELFNSREVRHVRNREVPSRHYDVVKPLGRKDLVFWKVFDNHWKIVGRIIVGHVTNNVIETNPGTKIVFGPTTCGSE